MTDNAVISYVMQKRKTKLLNLANQWQSQLQTIPEYRPDDGLSWWPTSPGEHEKMVNEVPALPNIPNGLNWNNYMEDTSSVGGEIEGDTGGPGQMEGIERNDYREMVDQMFGAWFEEDDSEDEGTNGHSHKRRKLV
jgi:hypothetical protein